MKNKKLIIGLIFVLAFIGVIVSVSFAYGITSTTGNENILQTIFKSNKVSIEYSDGNNELISNDSALFNPGSIIIKSFTIKNTGNKEATYSVALKDVVNNFERKNDITYEFKSGENIISSGIFPDTNIVLIENDTILKDSTKYYTLIIRYNESSENQIIDNGKTINANIDLY